MSHQPPPAPWPDASPPEVLAVSSGPRPFGVPDDAVAWYFVPPPEDPEGEAESAAFCAWLDAEIDAGREEIPAETVPPRAVIALGDAAGVDLALLGRMTGPDGLAGEGFAQDAMADAMRPGPLLDALATEAASHPDTLSDNELHGAMQAARRLRAHAAWLELNAIAEHILRNEARYQASTARGDKRLRLDGEYAEEELGIELLISRQAAARRAELAVALKTRLPRTFQGMRDGAIGEDKAGLIVRHTPHLSDENAAAADAILADAAPGIRPEAILLREAGASGTLDELTAQVFTDRLARRPSTVSTVPGTPPAPGMPSAPGGGPIPVPAILNVLISAGTLLGFSDAPGEANGWLLDADDSRAVVEAASLHPRTRWCVTVVDDTTGEAVAHGCSPGRHAWKPRPDHQRAELARLLRGLSVTLEPIAKGACDHRHREDRYEPSRKLRHLMNARTAACPAPGCGAQALHNETDHTRRWPQGETCEHNISPPCSRHHHAKHAPGWRLEQPEPGVMKWTLPSGRIHWTRPTRYDL